MFTGIYFSIFFLIWFSYFYLAKNIRIFSYFSLSFIFILVLFLLFLFNKSVLWYQLIFKFYTLSILGVLYAIGIDGLSFFLIILCVFILIYCLLAYWFLKYKVSLYSYFMLFSLWLLLNVFASLDLFFFYIYFEGIVIPMFLLIVYEEVVIVRFMLRISFLYIPY